MNSLTLNTLGYKLSTLRLEIDSQARPTAYLQFDVIADGQVVRAHGIQLDTDQARLLIIGNPILNSYKILCQELGEPDAVIYDDLYTDLLGNADAETLSQRIESLRDTYRNSTAALCSLAGAPIATKIEDIDFPPIRSAANAANLALASELRENILYSLLQLYRLDGNDAWDRI